MGVLRGVLGKAVSVTQALLGIAIGTIEAVKKGLAELAKGAIDPLARRKAETERRHYEDRQTEIDKEKLDILHQAKRDGRWSPNAVDRYEELSRESEGIEHKLGLRPKAIEAAPDDYDVVVVGPEHMHRLEWYVGQATDKRCRKCGLPMILQFPGHQARDPHPAYFWGCTGYYRFGDPRRCWNREHVTKDDLGTLLRRDNEALAMDRTEMCRKAFDNRYLKRIGQDLRELKGRRFPAYRCPIHGVGMMLMQKKREYQKGPLDVWYLKCPSPIPHNGGRGCGQTRKLKTVAQVLAVRQIGTGDLF